jgi:hypothetical protein
MGAEDEAGWRAEFEKNGEQLVTNLVHTGVIPEPQRQFGFRWLGEQAEARRLREVEIHWYTRWTFRAAVVGVLVGIVGVLVAPFH